MHWKNGPPPLLPKANCENTQRLASRSKVTVGSPLLSAAHSPLPPLKPCHSVLPSAGPMITAPFDLLKIVKAEFTHCTYCVVPAAPLVSGGAPEMTKPGNPLP